MPAKTVKLKEPVGLFEFMSKNPGNKFKFSEGGVPSAIKVTAYRQVRRTMHLILEVTAEDDTS